MDGKKNGNNNNNSEGEDDMDLRRGPWTVDEDLTLINYISIHGEGRWNSLARCAGLKRTGKSCRLRWLNYLRPDVRRGNITLEEQLMILELHSRWGNRWSKIAQYLPGRTDNEIKNYWRTRVQKHAKQLKCDVNSKQFKDTMRYLWMPRLVERIQAAAANSTATPFTGTAPTTAMAPTIGFSDHNQSENVTHYSHAPDNSTNSGDSFNTQVSDATNYYSLPLNNINVNQNYIQDNQVGYMSCDYANNQMDYQVGNLDQNGEQPWSVGLGDTAENLWNIEDILFLQNQLNNNI